MTSALTKDEVALFFKNLGYKVDWNYKGTDAWLEIREGSTTLIIVDMSIPLPEVIEDLSFLSDSSEKVFKLIKKYEIFPSNLLKKDSATKKILNKIKKYEVRN